MLNILFIGITLVTLILFYFGTGKNKVALITGILWLTTVGAIASTGYFENMSSKPPSFLWLIMVAIVLSIFFYKKVDSTKISPVFLIAVHTIRLPVELVLYQLFLLKLVPVLMTYYGWNFDIVMGISAILILIYWFLTGKKPGKHFLMVWNIMGLIFLSIIVTIAILSSKLPVQQLAFDQPNIAIPRFPFIYLPAYIVPVVCLSHILLMKTAKKD